MRNLFLVLNCQLCAHMDSDGENKGIKHRVHTQKLKF